MTRKGAPRLIDEMTEELGDAVAQDEGCMLSWNTFQRGPGISFSSKEDEVRVLLRTMSIHEKEASFQEQGCFALLSVMPTMESLDVVTQEDSLRVIVVAISNFPDNRRILELGMQALASLADCVDNARKIIMDAEMPCILNSLRCYPDDDDIQQYGVHLLSCLCRHPANSTLVVKQGGVDIVLDAMVRHRQHVQIQKEGCSVMASCACNALDVGHIVAKAGIQAVLGAMETHAQDEIIQTRGCSVLKDICSSGDFDKVVNEGGASVVVNAMCTHKEAFAVQVLGCTILSCLAKDPACVKNLPAGKALKALLHAMSQKGAGNMLELLAFSAMCNACVHWEPGEHVSLEPSDICTISTFMRAHIQHVKRQIGGCNLLSFLSQSGVKAAQVIQGGALDTTLQAMSNHKQNKEMQEQGCLAMYLLILEPWRGISDSDTQALHKKLIVAALDAISAHKSVQDVKFAGCKLLSGLVGNDQNVSEMVKHGGIAAVVDAMKSLDDILDMQIFGCTLLGKFAQLNADTAVEIGKAGGVDAICAIQHAFTSMEAESDLAESVELASLHDAYTDALNALRRATPQNEAKVSAWQAREIRRLAEVCTVCGSNAVDAGRDMLLQCSACTIAPLYCSEACQRIAWKEHKELCKAHPKAKVKRG